MRSRLFAVLLSAGVLLTACGGGSSGAREPVRHPPETSSSAPSSAPADDPVDVRGSPAIAEIRRRGTLLVGLRSDAPEFVRRAGGEYSGFDVRVARMLAEGLGLDPKTQVAFRRLPDTLRVDAVLGGSVDLQLGGFESDSKLATVGPYVVTGPPGSATEHFIGIEPGDPVLRDRLRAILAKAQDRGRLQRAVEASLSGADVRARVPDLPR